MNIHKIIAWLDPESADWPFGRQRVAIAVMQKFRETVLQVELVSQKLWNSFLLMGWNVTTEIVAINKHGQVWLGERTDPEDPYYGKLDIPGSTHKLFGSAKLHLKMALGKLKGAKILSGELFCCYTLENEGRGPYTSWLYVVKIEGTPTGPGQFADPDMLPERLVENCAYAVRMAYGLEEVYQPPSVMDALAA